jgi:hypothetical protein
MNRRLALTLISLMLLSALATVSHAATVMYTDRSAWEAAVGTWADVDLTPYLPEYSTLTSVALPALAAPATTLSFDVTQTVLQVGSSWGTWSSDSPVVLWNYNESAVIGTFDSAVRGFGLEMEPNPFSVYDMTLKLEDGSSLTQAVNGSGGAAFFGFVSDTPVVTYWQAFIDGETDFAMGNLVVASPEDGGGNGSPELSTWMLLACSGLAGLVIRRRRS